jgi:hypothetical protein
MKREKKKQEPVISETPEKIIKFDMKSENTIREQARKEYEIAKNFRLAKLPICKFYSASEPSARKQFNLGQKTDLTIFEIKLTTNEQENLIRINESKDFLQTQDNIEIINDKTFKYADKDLVHRFLVFCK